MQEMAEVPAEQEGGWGPLVRRQSLRVYGRRPLFMHVNAKKTAVSGLLMALSVLLLVLSGVLDFSTLFFLAAAAFFVGIIIKEYTVLVTAQPFSPAVQFWDFFWHHRNYTALLMP